MNKKIKVTMFKHFNKYSHEVDYKLLSNSSMFPIGVYADDENQAIKLCDHFLGSNNYYIEKVD